MDDPRDRVLLLAGDLAEASLSVDDAGSEEEVMVFLAAISVLARRNFEAVAHIPNAMERIEALAEEAIDVLEVRRLINMPAGEA